MSVQKYETGISIPQDYKEPEGFRVFFPEQKDIIARASDNLLDWATGEAGVGDGDKVIFTYLPRILGLKMGEEMTGKEIDLRLVAFEPLYLLAGGLMDRVADLPDSIKQKSAEYRVAEGIVNLFSGLQLVADSNSSWGKVTKRIDRYGEIYLHITSSMGQHQMIEFYRHVDSDYVGIRYHERNPGQAVSDSLPNITHRLGVALGSIDSEIGTKLVLKLFAREEYWIKGQKPHKLIVDDSEQARRSRRNLRSELFDENDSITLAFGDEFVIGSMLRKFAHDMGAGRIYAAQPGYVPTFRKLRETHRF